VFTLLSLSSFAFSQTASKDNLTAAKSMHKSESTAQKEVLDTDESLRYMGSRLLFQVKKRLHLVDENELQAEKQAQEKSKNVKFSLFGLTIEKD
jgi:hypothetical protein